MNKSSRFPFSNLCFLIFPFLIFFISPVLSFSQSFSTANVSADLQSDFQYNNETSKDSAIGMHTYLNMAYRYMGLELGFRYEAYQKPMLGYNKNMGDQGIPHRYVSFQKNRFKVTGGNYYVQFGAGIALRAYEARGLGIDNSLDGVKIDYNIADKIFFTALSGRQRYHFEPRDKNKPIIRGGDMNISVSEFFAKEPKLNMHVGGSYVSRYFQQWADVLSPSNDTFLHPFVNVYAGRMDVLYKNFSIGGEYAQKTGDPTDKNFKKDTTGHALYLTTSYSGSGLGINIQYKETNDFDFRSDPMTTDNEHTLNFLPPFTRQPVFKLFSKYPYQTQNTGEKGIQGEINYSPKIGDNLLFHHTQLYNLKNDKYYNEFSFEGEKKLSSKQKLVLAYSYIEIDAKTVLLSSKAEFVYASIFAIEDVFRINRKHALRPAVQYLYTEQDNGNWIFYQIEYTVAPHFSFSVFNENNIGKEKRDLYTVFASYTDGNTKFSLSYGKQSAGISCVGGVCRFVPAFSGLTFSVISKL